MLSLFQDHSRKGAVRKRLRFIWSKKAKGICRAEVKDVETFTEGKSGRWSPVRDFQSQMRMRVRMAMGDPEALLKDTRLSHGRGTTYQCFSSSCLGLAP